MFSEEKNPGIIRRGNAADFTAFFVHHDVFVFLCFQLYTARERVGINIDKKTQIAENTQNTNKQIVKYKILTSKNKKNGNNRFTILYF